MKEKEQAEKVLKKFKNIFNKLVKKCDSNKISYHPFSDSVVVGFKEINDALSFSKALFRKTFSKKIPLRGTIGIGELTHKPDPYNKFSFTIGSGLVLANMPERYHIKGHTLLLVCENKEGTYFGHDLIIFEDEEIHVLSKEFKAYIVPWWKKSESKELKNEIDKRTHGLDVEKIIYLEKTKEHMNYFKERDTTSESKPMANAEIL
ncbi:MAG: hypothetical protein Q8N79_02590 [Candidatus Methanoperedens sp.]|nr:hypothetical protein [Candidatus Methanoperedens sp.]